MNFSIFFLRINHLLKEEHCDFKYQRKNCKKHGHYKKKKNKITGEVNYEIRIEKDDNDAAKIYTLCHEMAHFLNKHLDNKDLTYAQKEWVAHYVGMYFIEKYDLVGELKKAKINKKFDIFNYANKWIENKKITPRRQLIMDEQLKNTILKIRISGHFD